MNKEQDVSLLSFIICVFVRVCVVMFGHLFQSDTTLSIFASIQVHRDEGTQTHTQTDTDTDTDLIALPKQLSLFPPSPSPLICSSVHAYTQVFLLFT